MTRSCLRFGLIMTLVCMTAVADAQPPFGGPRGGFGPGGPRAKRELVKDFDKDENGWLNREERAAARAAAESEPTGGRRGFGPPGGRRGRGNREPAKPGRQVNSGDVGHYPDVGLYEPTVLRTLFFEFENEDWEKELEVFRTTDVEVPATLTVDGKQYPNVGMRFRGASSYFMVPTGYKRSFNVSIDLADEEQRLYGFKTLNLLNSSGDPSFLSTVLYSNIAANYIPVPKANHVHVVINGESWGVFVNVQQFDKTFLAEHYKSSKGTRWKVSGSPRGDGGLRYLGEDLEEYKKRFDMKSNDGKKAWAALVKLCKTLDETPTEELESKLEPLLDIDETLRFLALDVALVNSDGYWTRASDYSLFRDSDKRFHIIPHDMNEAFRVTRGRRGPRRGPGGFGRPGTDRNAAPEGNRGAPSSSERRDPPRPPRPGGRERDRGPGLDEPGRNRDGFGPGGFGPGGFGPGGFGPRGPSRGRGGFGGPGGRGHGGVDLDPLVSIDDDRMPLRSRLLAVPKLRAKYLQYIREIAEHSLDWNYIKPVIVRHSTLIKSEVAADTRKLDSLDAFQQTVALRTSSESPDERSLRSFFDRRREFLMDYKEPVDAEQRRD